MAITYEKVQDLTITIVDKFDEGLKGSTPIYPVVAPTIASTGEGNTYPMAELPDVREFIDKRKINNLEEAHITVVNRTWESTLEIARKFLDDDNYGFYARRAYALGINAAKHPDKLLAELIMDGFDKGLGYDGVAFFSDKHPKTKSTDLQSNVQAGSGEPWVLVDMSKGMWPFFYQLREAPKMERPQGLSDYTFMFNQYLFGSYARYAMGYGLWQLAYASKGELNQANYEKAVESMGSLSDLNGYGLGVAPTHILVGSKNRAAARNLFKAQTLNGSSNVYFEDVEILDFPYLVAKGGTTNPEPEGENDAATKQAKGSK